MDSEDSDVGTTITDLLGPGFSTSHPHLLLFEQQEASARIAYARAHHNRTQSEGTDGGETDQDEDELDCLLDDIRFCKTLRFFRSMEGFYKGSLDLTGRHLPRFLELQEQWNAYIVDFLDVSVDAKEFTSNEKGKNDAPIIDYRFKHKSAWKKFRQRWKIAAQLDYSRLLFETRKVLATIAKHNTPQIQHLCLADLPPELLNYIFQAADSRQARLLSSTCHHLNAIGQRHILKSRCLAFKFSRRKAMNYLDDAAADKHLKRMAISSCEQVLSVSNFLLDRPDLRDALRDLSISDEWNMGTFKKYFVNLTTFDLDEEFREPVYHSFTTVLAASANITTLKLYNVVLSFEMIKSIHCLHHLISLHLHRCNFAKAVRNLLRHEPGRLVWNSVYNLHLVCNYSSSPCLWEVFLLCPNLRTFSTQDNSGGLTPLPLLPVGGTSSFATLERIYLEGMSREDMVDYVLWLSSGPELGGLTHFKIHVHDGLSDDIILLLLDSFTRSRSPLQVLSLEGLAEAEFGLFDEIVRRFPNLRSLTLVRRASNGQTDNKTINWPHAAWEYARRLEGLTQLQHFEWNSDEALCASSATLLRFEEGFYDEDVDADNWEDARDDDFFDDDRWTPAVFAVYCPNLQTYAVSQSAWDWWLIGREKNGTIVVQRPPDRYIPPWDQWNPTQHTGHWPCIIPEEQGAKSL